MLYTIGETSIKLNVSKQIIHNKIKLPMFKDKILKKNGKSYIDEDILSLIQDNLELDNDFKKEIKSKDIEEGKTNPTPEIKSDASDFNKKLVDALIDQLKVKDLQISELHKLIENNQVLLKDKPQQEILQLEAHFNDLDNNLQDVSENVQHKKEQPKRESLFRRIFKHR